MFKFFHAYGILLLILLVSITILGGCGTTDKMDFYDNTENTSLSEKVNTISLNSKEDVVREALGEPDFVEETEKPKSTYLIYGKDKENRDIEFQLVAGKVNRYFFSSNTYKTTKGIMKGNSKEDVLQAYGESYYERNDSGAKVIGYFDKTKKVNIEFSFNDSEVVEGIMVSEIN